ncbi:MAG: hypothetical protein CMC35_09120 [Flavobacteriaceae bacterium]|nr:hypothetical protein [Flavobacteriaceae bacterium]|tara:strand:- start:3012 stop:3443 length:432 start_codon:yes stop_codon:yes gene_type:complete
MNLNKMLRAFKKARNSKCTFALKRQPYHIVFLIVLSMEVCIALCFKHGFIRGFIGDVLVIPLLYCFLRVVTSWSISLNACIAVAIGFVVEFLQLFSWLQPVVNLHPILKILLGSVFDGYDLLAYTVGFGGIFLSEKLKSNLHS